MDLKTIVKKSWKPTLKVGGIFATALATNWFVDTVGLSIDQGITGGLPEAYSIGDWAGDLAGAVTCYIGPILIGMTKSTSPIERGLAYIPQVVGTFIGLSQIDEAVNKGLILANKGGSVHGVYNALRNNFGSLTHIGASVAIPVIERHSLERHS